MKTEETEKLEQKIYRATRKLGTYGCFEVTIGNERVDYLTCDTKGNWRCYEIKVSKNDFFSHAAKTFVGQYNYYVMPDELYEKVKDSIPECVGVHNGDFVIKRAKKVPLSSDEKILSAAMIRSLYRDSDKLHKIEDGVTLNKLKRDCLHSEQRAKDAISEFNHLYCSVAKKYGHKEARDLTQESI